MKKQLITLFYVVFAPLTFAQPTAPTTTENISTFQPDTGLAALDFTFEKNSASAEALGLFTLPSSQLSPVDKNVKINPWLQLSTASYTSVDNENSAISFYVDDMFNDSKQHMNATLSFGKFHTVAQIKANNDNLFSDNSISITGYYDLYSKASFTLSVKANVNTLNAGDVARYYQTIDYKSVNTTIFSNQATNHSFGIVGTLQLSPNWRASGELSTTNLDQQVEQSPFIRKNSVQMAQIKTSYAF